MLAFNYIDRFAELAELPQLRKLEVLEQAHRGVAQAWTTNILNFVICLAVGFVIAFGPRMFFELPGIVEGLLLGMGTLVAIGLSRRLYARLLHGKVIELLGAERA